MIQRIALAIGLVLLCAAGPILAMAGRAAGSPPAWPGNDRTALAPPDTLWRAVLSAAGSSGRPLGYTLDEMEGYGRDIHRMRTVFNLFQDARTIPRFSGRTAEDLLAAASSPAELVQRAFLLTDISAGRMLPMPDSAAWGRPGLPDDAEPLEVMRALSMPPAAGEADPFDSFRRLSQPAQRLVARLCLGAAEAGPWLQRAYDRELLPRGVSLDSLYTLATDPWTRERLGQYAVPHRRSFDLLDRLDREFLAFGSVIFLTHLERALREYRTSGSGLREETFPAFLIPTPMGSVVVSGAGDDHHDRLASLCIDFGGNDRYSGRHGVPASLEAPIGLVLDLDGNDEYAGGDLPASLACGLFGLGVIVDMKGDDQYRCAESGLGAAWHGVGMLYDAEGDDVYVIDSHHGQGQACAGVGILADLSGHDSYTCGYGSQGFGMTLGAGILLDVEGNDSYLARDDGNPSELYLGQSVSMSQGVGDGRRADLGDGHSLAGGFGVLVDGSGDDSYHASAWSQGAGYWWAVGILEDLGGNDRYRNGKYSLGAGAHFAIGCQVDLEGDDEYNRDNEEAVNQFQGHARDGSIGVSLDGDGDDYYQFRSHCGGSADLCSIGLFWDRRGNDHYECRYGKLGDSRGWSDTPPLGSATVYTPFHSFRDELDAVGIFLDTGGTDKYMWGADSQGLDLPPAENNARWPSRRGPGSFGLGVDEEWYPPSK